MTFALAAQDPFFGPFSRDGGIGAADASRTIQLKEIAKCKKPS